MLLKLLSASDKTCIRCLPVKEIRTRTLAACYSSSSIRPQKLSDDLDESTATWGPLFKKDKSRTYAGYEESNVSNYLQTIISMCLFETHIM